MPTELRRLIFSREELVKAISNFREVSGNGIPAGNIVYCQIMRNSDLSVSVKFLPEGESQFQSEQLGVDIIGPALMKYCLDHKIPLPRNSEKAIEVIGENIAMTVSIARPTVQLSDEI